MGRYHPSVRSVLRFFAFGHLPSHLQVMSRRFATQAFHIADHLSGPEATVALRKLLESKDAAVRAMLPEPNVDLSIEWAAGFRLEPASDEELGDGFIAIRNKDDCALTRTEDGEWALTEAADYGSGTMFDSRETAINVILSL